MAGASQLLKQGTSRRVSLEQRDGEWFVVKRFEHRDLLGRTFDARRARREFEILGRLARAGVAVPRPLGLVRDGRAHAVRIEWLAGARPLAEVLARGEPVSLDLARALGRLLAGLHGARVDHPDLHAGNLLVDPEDRAFAVDFDKARIARALPAKLARRDLVSLCAGLRETTSLPWRRVAFEAWWEALAPELSSRWPRPDGAELEELARAHRRRVVRRRERRFTRAGSAVSALDSGGGFARHGVTEGIVAAARAGRPLPTGLLRVDDGARRVLALWNAMARLEEHGLAAPRCQVLLRAPHAAAVFRLPGRPTPASARDEGRVLGGLLDRGLWLADLAPQDLAACGLVRPRRLVDLPPERARATLAPWLARHGAAGSADRAAFTAGVRDAWRGSRRAAEALLAEPLRG